MQHDHMGQMEKQLRRARAIEHGNRRPSRALALTVLHCGHGILARLLSVYHSRGPSLRHGPE